MLLKHKLLCSFISCTLLGLVSARSEVFIPVNWSDLSIGPSLPVCSATYPLGPHFADSTYTVHLDYPEYIPLTRAEAEALTPLSAAITADSIVPTCHVGVSRKAGYLDISFVPIVWRDGCYQKLVSYKLSVQGRAIAKRTTRSSRRMMRALAAGSSPYAAHSVLAEGKWAKISVPNEGVYQLTTTQLATMGFRDPTRVKLYGYGGLMQDSVITYTGAMPNPDDLTEIPLCRTADGKLLFYSEGTTRWRRVGTTWRHENNPYARAAYYFVTEGDAPLVMTSEAASSNQTGRDIVSAHALYEEDAYSWYTSGRQFFDSYDFAYGNTHTFNLAAPGVVDSTANVCIVFSASNNAPTNVAVTLNGETLGSLSVPQLTVRSESGYKAKMTEKNFSTRALAATGNAFRFTTTAGHAARLDYISLTYPRRLTLTAGYLSFSDSERSGTGYYTLHGADQSTQLWRIGTTLRATTRVEGTLAGSDLNVALPEATDLYVAVNTAATFPTPTYVGAVANQDLHADSAVQMVIIIPESGKLRTQAERLAAAHAEKGGLRTKVVRADEIYNEFSSGTPDAMAYRRYLKMLYDRASSEADMPTYLLLMGNSAWDNRMVTPAWSTYDPRDYLLCYESWNSINEIESYVTDDFFGFLDDGEGQNLTTDKIDLAIGRFPVSTDEEARAMVDKSIAYMQNGHVGAWKNLICMMGDDDVNSNSLMSDAEEVAQRIERNYPDYQIKRIYWDAYTRVSSTTGNSYPQIRELLLNLMKQGALVMNYTGHGSPDLVSHEKVLSATDFTTVQTTNLPLWVSASCEMTPFDTQEASIGASAMLNPTGGAIAFVSATRSVYSTRNKYLNKYFMDYVLGSTNGRRNSIGEALMLAKLSLVTGGTGQDRYMTDRTINKLKYNLVGDPALVLGGPEQQVVLDSIDGQAVSAGVVPLKAGSVVRVSGHIASTGGDVLNDFTGSLTTSVFDRKETITCKGNANTSTPPYTYQDRTKKLFEGTDSVSAGHFSFLFPVSLDASYSTDTGLFSFYAVSNDHATEAHGSNESFNVSSGGEVSTDSLGPRLFVYLNSPEFEDGGKVNTTPYFVAIIADSDGINATGSGVGHDLELIIDGSAATSYVLNDYFTNDFGSYTQGTVRYSIPALTAGRHRLAFRAWDMKNNSSTAVLNFVVDENARPALLDVSASENPATEQTTFTLSYDRPESNVLLHLDVYDVMGQHVWRHSVAGTSADGHYPITWNLTNQRGGRVAGGVYLYRAGVSLPTGGKVSTKTKKIIILNNK